MSHQRYQASQRRGVDLWGGPTSGEVCGNLEGKSGKLPRSLWIAFKIHSEGSSGEVAGVRGSSGSTLTWTTFHLSLSLLQLSEDGLLVAKAQALLIASSNMTCLQGRHQQRKRAGLQASIMASMVVLHPLTLILAHALVCHCRSNADSAKTSLVAISCDSVKSSFATFLAINHSPAIVAFLQVRCENASLKNTQWLRPSLFKSTPRFEVSAV